SRDQHYLLSFFTSGLASLISVTVTIFRSGISTPLTTFKVADTTTCFPLSASTCFRRSLFPPRSSAYDPFFAVSTTVPVVSQPIANTGCDRFQAISTFSGSLAPPFGGSPACTERAPAATNPTANTMTCHIAPLPLRRSKPRQGHPILDLGWPAGCGPPARC